MTFYVNCIIILLSRYYQLFHDLKIRRNKMKQNIENTSPADPRKNPRLCSREDLTPAQIRSLFYAYPELILRNEKIQLPKDLILEVLKNTISVKVVIEIFSRPETKEFYTEAVETFILSYKSSFTKFVNGGCPGYVIDSQFDRVVEELRHAGIIMSDDCVQKAHSS